MARKKVTGAVDPDQTPGQVEASPAPMADTDGAAGRDSLPQAGEACSATPPASPDTDPTGLTAIEVIGPKAGRWRIGRQFTADPVLIRLEDLTEDAIAALMSDPRLKTQLI